MVAYRNFCNKIWNAVKYMRMQTGDFDFQPNATANPTGKESKCDLWVLSRLGEAVATIDQAMKVRRSSKLDNYAH